MVFSVKSMWRQRLYTHCMEESRVFNYCSRWGTWTVSRKWLWMHGIMVLNEPPGTVQDPLACSNEHGTEASGFKVTKLLHLLSYYLFSTFRSHGICRHCISLNSWLVCKKVKQSHQGLDRSWGFQKVKGSQISIQSAYEGGKVVSTGRLYLPGNIPGTNFC
jgi:hypothetical protein